MQFDIAPPFRPRAVPSPPALRMAPRSADRGSRLTETGTAEGGKAAGVRDRARRGVLYGVAFASLAVLALTHAVEAGADETGATATVEDQAGDALTEAAITARQAELAADVAPLRREYQGLEPDSPEGLRLHELLEICARIELTLNAELQVRRRLAARPEAPPSGDESVPASIFGLNQVHQDLETAESEQGKLENAVAASRDALAAAKDEYEQAERKRREARDAAEDLTSAGAAPGAAPAVQRRRLESRAALETVHLRALELQAAGAALEAQRARMAELRLQLARIEDAVRNGTDDPSSGQDDLRRRQRASERTRAGLDREIATAETRLATAKGRYARSAAPSPAALEDVETLTIQLDALQQKASATDARAERLATQQATLERWRQVLRGEAQSAEIRDWRRWAEQRARDLELAEAQREGQIAELRERARAGQDRLAGLAPDDAIGAPLEARTAALDDLVAFYRVDVEQLAGQRRLLQRFVHAIDQQTGHLNLGQQARTVAGFLPRLWNYELTVIDDQGITVGEVVIALALIVLGFIVSRRLSRAFAQSLHRRLRLDAGATAAIQTLTFYLLLVVFVLLSLRTVNFPLTAFTILGGALAIGVGFGSQNVMNNFISGLILMLERPIRSGDLVDVEGSFGTVERIGARSTQIRASDNTQLIVPNSFFLENKVVNWTLSDDVVRTQVNVGVTYGSPTRTVQELLRRVLDENDRILRTPEPVIVFADFGGNSLNFEVYFWVRARTPMAIRRIGSDVRFRIDDLFREAKIAIAFPQRDVHLDAAAPLDVRLVAGSSTEPGA